jgi:hypothetical protein
MVVKLAKDWTLVARGTSESGALPLGRTIRSVFGELKSRVIVEAGRPFLSSSVRVKSSISQYGPEAAGCGVDGAVVGGAVVGGAVVVGAFALGGLVPPPHEQSTTADVHSAATVAVNHGARRVIVPPIRWPPAPTRARPSR